MPTLPEPIEISKFWANRGGEAVIVRLCELEGQTLIDVRKYYSAADGTLRPSQKGIALSIHRLPELAVAVGKALMKARQLGLLGGKP
jgi:hypothetical protein